MEINKSNLSGCSGLQNDFSALSLQPSSNRNNLEKALENLSSNKPSEELFGVQTIRKELCKDSPPRDEVLNTKIIPTLMQMVYAKDEKFSLEVCWILCNIASGSSSHIEYLLNLNCLSFLIDLFDSNQSSTQLKDQIVWTIGNIAAESEKIRDLVNDSGFLSRILNFGEDLFNSRSKKFMKNVFWTAGILIRQCSDQQVLKTVDLFFTKFLKFRFKPKTLEDLLQGIVYTSQSLKDFKNYGKFVRESLAEFLKSSFFNVRYLALKVIGNMIFATKKSWFKVKKMKILPLLKDFLAEDNFLIRQKTVWVFSNLAAESQEALTEMMGLKVFHHFFEVFDCEDERIVNHVVMTVLNCLTIANKQDVHEMVRMGWLLKLSTLLCKEFDEDVKLQILLVLYKNLKKHPELVCLQLKENLFFIYEQFKVKQESFEMIRKILKWLDCKNMINR